MSPCPAPGRCRRAAEWSWAIGASLSLAPENTLSSIRQAARAGATWVEIDVDVLGDGTPIVIHDSSLDRTTNRSGPYDHLSQADLHGIDAGSWFIAEDGSRPYSGEPLPTLGQVLEMVAAEGLSVNVEMKPCEAGARVCAELVDAVARHLDQFAATAPGSQAVASSFNPLLLDRLGRRRPATRLALLMAAGMPTGAWRSYAEMLGVEAINPADEGLERALVEEIRALGYGVNVWTINSPQRAEELFSWGVSGIFTDRIHEFGHLVTEM
ncbi:glycerophosphodiester phosphodiesterase family protein [Actinomyces timonensis]|uniref:glycerophosphodiester phosphodiesterase family protein n=1 Tax=Actinomyces timonensis TaxID=1288391 RepID=UPI0009E59571|nr:glycerophosphodiester phosphodiesterase family protein [Actinomyces timonensis]